MSIILFLIILTALIFVHELGHFSMAKYFGIRVDEFAIGFPPKIWSVKKGETKYAVNLIPFGGYVKIFGENPDEDSLNGPDKDRSLVNAPKWKQLAIVLAGIFMNFIFAWLLLSIAFNIGLSVPSTEYRNDIKNITLTITSVMKNSPADIAGLKTGDAILSIVSAGTTLNSPSSKDLEKVISESSDKLSILYKRGNATGSIDIVAKDGVIEGKKAIGVSMDMVGYVKFGFLRSFFEGARLTWIETKEIGIGIFNFIAGAVTGKSGAFADIAGPVGIAGMVGEAEHMGFSFLLEFISIISINLAVLNFIPFPALDGGRALFIFIEFIFRKKIKPVILNSVNLVGFALLMALMLFITYKDILRLIK